MSLPPRGAYGRPGSAGGALAGTGRLGRRSTGNPASIRTTAGDGENFMLQGYAANSDRNGVKGRDVSINKSPRFADNDTRFTYRPTSAPATKLLGSDSIWSLQQLAAGKPKKKGSGRRPKTASQLASAMSSKHSASGAGPRPPLRSSRGRISPRHTYDFTNKVGVEDIPEDRPTFGEPLGQPKKGKFYSVRPSTGKGSRPGTAKAPIQLEFKSNALEMEVNLLQTLRDRKARSEPPCPIRLEVFREVFAQVIDKDIIYGPILERIKTEYEVFINPLESDSMKTLYESALHENDKLRDQFDSLVAEHHTLQKDAVQLSNENVRLRSALEEKTKENEDLKNDLASDNPLYMKQQAQAIRIRELEEDLKLTSITSAGPVYEGSGAGGASTRGGDGGSRDDVADAIASARSEGKSDEQIIAQLKAELELARRRTLAALEDVELLKEELARNVPDKYGKLYADKVQKTLSFEDDGALMGVASEDALQPENSTSTVQVRPMTVPPLRNLPSQDRMSDTGSLERP